MKKIFLILTVLALLAPSVASAGVYNATWVGTSTAANAAIFPKPVNNTYPPIRIPYVVATSTTAISTFANGIHIGGSASSDFILDFLGNAGTPNAIFPDEFIQFGKDLDFAYASPHEAVAFGNPAGNLGFLLHSGASLVWDPNAFGSGDEVTFDSSGQVTAANFVGNSSNPSTLTGALTANNLSAGNYAVTGGGQIAFYNGANTGSIANTTAGKYSFVGNTGTSRAGILDFTSMASSDKTFTFPNTTGTLALKGTLFDHFADAKNTTTTETDLYSDTLPASTFNANGDKVIAQYGGTITGAVSSTQEIRVYLGGTLIFDSGALSIGVATDSWDLSVSCVRESSSTVRCSVSMTTNFATLSSYATYTKVTGLTLTNTQILKVTGQAAGVGAASNQISASEGYVEFKVAA